MFAPDIAQANVVLVQGGDFVFQILAQQVHQEVDFSLRAPLPIFRREGVERERGHTDACSGLDRIADRLHSRAMARDAGQMPLARPAAVAVHDDGYMAGQAGGIELGEQLRFFAVESCGNVGRYSHVWGKIAL